MAFKFPESKQRAFSGRENTSSGKPKEAMDLRSGVKDVARALSPGAPGSPNGAGSGMRIKMPAYRDQSDVHSCKGVNPEDVTQSKKQIEPQVNITGHHDAET